MADRRRDSAASIDVTLIDLSSLTPVELSAMRALVPTEERRLGSPRVVGRGALRIVLARRLDTTPGMLAIRTPPGGAPGGPPGTALSMSHSGELVGIAISEQVPRVGVDVERERGTLDATRLAQRWFAAPEAAYVQAGRTRAARTARFIRIWTAKEAWVKTRSATPRVKLQAFLVDLENARIEDPSSTVGGAIAALDAPPGYVGTIAAAGAAPLAPRIEHTTVAELLAQS